MLANEGFLLHLSLSASLLQLSNLRLLHTSCFFYLRLEGGTFVARLQRLSLHGQLVTEDLVVESRLLVLRSPLFFEQPVSVLLL